MLKVVSEMKPGNESQQWVKQIGSTIQQRTHSRVQGLQIDVSDHEITVFGRVGTYHVLQLALDAVKDLQAEYRVPVRVQVQVFQQPTAA